MLGDTIYSDSEVPGRLNPIALSVQQKWAKYKVNLGNRSLRALRRSAGFYSHWDDHEFVNDFSPAENSFDNGVNMNGRTLYNRGAQAFRDYAPVQLDAGATGSTGPSAGAATSSCSSSTSARSAAPTRTRTASATTRRPASPTWLRPRRRARATCFALVDPVARGAGVAGMPRHDPQPEPHLPGPAPARALPARRQALDRPLQGDHERDADPAVLRAARTTAGRASRPSASRVLRELQSVKNVIFLTTDVHATLVNDARFQTLEERWRRRTAGSWT